ncbi:hypothetical protein HYALB_00009491 [Hymenoscyphus albidus]|uniref:RING-type domain-containing protein n=1 Tax=Hymenoscyphus albidus TaxID=595503 RepID=A0A9N9LXM7_9HELO|nr:hypothetical protein HYALB_00009491 [Hymenoscyphus albidus]
MEPPDKLTRLFGVPYLDFTARRLQPILRQYNLRPGHKRKAELFRQLQEYSERQIEDEDERNILQEFAQGEIDIVQLQHSLQKRHRGIQDPPLRQSNIIKVEPGSNFDAHAAIAETRSCDVCMEDLEFNEFPAQVPTISCEHKVVTCNGCLRRSIEVQIHESPGRITCPTCPQQLQFEDVKKYASREEFERYDRHCLMASFTDDPFFTPCLGPGCGSGQIHYGGHDEKNLILSGRKELDRRRPAVSI